MLHHPSIRESVKHWQVFEDNQEIFKFMTLIEDFFETHIDLGEEKEEEEVAQLSLGLQDDHISGHKVVQLRNGHIPYSLIPLEFFFIKTM